MAEALANTKVAQFEAGQSLFESFMDGDGGDGAEAKTSEGGQGPKPAAAAAAEDVLDVAAVVAGLEDEAKAKREAATGRKARKHTSKGSPRHFGQPWLSSLQK